MKRFVTMVCMWLMFAGSVFGATIKVKLYGHSSSKGSLRVALFKGPDGFPSERSKAVQRVSIPSQRSGNVVAFNNVPAGQYAIAAYHDKNSNNKLDKSFFGRPKEKFGFSNNPEPPRRGPVAYRKAAFKVGRMELVRKKILLDK